MFDVFGDLHGHADALVALLRKLGYEMRRGAFRHPERQAVFVGDFLDRGPKIKETLGIVRGMIEAGAAQAVLGNHEWNAFGFHMEDPDAPGEYLRRRTPRNLMQHSQTLEQVDDGDLADHLRFLRTLPLSLELPGLRVVHACWDEAARQVITDALERHVGLTDAFLIEAHDPETVLYDAVEVLLKGREMNLPNGSTYVDKDGQLRERARVRWFESPLGQTLRTYTFPIQNNLPDVPLPARVRAEARPYHPQAPPVFFGHYWLDPSEPRALAENVACLDYSVARGGFLCAYRFDGEAKLRSDLFER
jgi:Calcineurin-like phosphoesterase